MRKSISLFITFIMIFMMVAPSMTFADYDKGLQEAILKAKELFSITEEYDVFNYSVSSNNSETEYSLSWSDSGNKLGGIRITINGDGNVTNYYKYDRNYYDYKPKLAKISKSEAREIAEKFIVKVNSKHADKIQYLENNKVQNVNEINYHLTFSRKENGVLFYNNSIRVVVNNMTGEVNNYYTDWEDTLVFPDVESIINLEEAKEIFKDQIGLKLMYKFKYEDNKMIPYLVFSRVTNNDYIDALTGEVIKIKGNFYFADETAMEFSMNSKSRQSVDISPEEKKAIENMSGILSEEEAESIAREVLKIDDSHERTWISLYNQWRNKEDYTWNMRFADTDDEAKGSISVSIDAKTGELMSFSKYVQGDDSQEVVYDKEGAYDIAESFIREMEAEKYGEVEYVTWNEPVIRPMNEEEKPSQYSFTFARKANEAYVQSDGFTVTVDTKTGNIIRYNLSWFNGELPLTDNIIPMDKVYDSLFNNVGMELKYITEYLNINEKYPYKSNPSNKIVRIVYSIKSDKPSDIDALNGDVLNYNGEVYTEETVSEYTDINDSYAKSQIEVLAQYGISLPGDKFEPTNQITQRDFLYLLAKANNYYIHVPFSEDSQFDDEFYNVLMNQGIIIDGEKSPLSAVSRQDAVKFIIRALNYDEIADIQGIFVVNFKDAEKIAPELKGYVAIAHGLNIISGYDGYFNPSSKLTREQAATIIYNFLNSNS